MANPEHVEVARGGKTAIEDWCLSHPDGWLDLEGANLAGVRLRGVERLPATLRHADLSGADLSWSGLPGDMHAANLTRASLGFSTLIGVDLAGACLSEAKLTGARLVNVDLSGADLRRAEFVWTAVQMTEFRDASVQGLVLSGTSFWRVDLAQARGLSDAFIGGTCSLDWETIVRSWPLPESFLRGCGFPDELITYLPSILNASPIQYYPVFISYSAKDDEFVRGLYADLQVNNVRCWFAPEDLPIGRKIRTGIEEAIRIHDKLLLVLSATSVKSTWVEDEVEAAFEKERKTGRDVLFPIAIDDEGFHVESGWAAAIRRKINIGDFRRWKDHDEYTRAFDRLLRDLKQAVTQRPTAPPI